MSMFMFYNKEYYCTYPVIFELLSKDGDKRSNCDNCNTPYTEEEKDIIQQISYKNDLLNIFFLSELEDDKINGCIQSHFDSIDPKLLECSQILASKFSSKDARFGFSLLFAYDYLHYTHTCMCEFLIHGKISQASLQDLQNAIHATKI